MIQRASPSLPLYKLQSRSEGASTWYPYFTKLLHRIIQLTAGSLLITALLLEYIYMCVYVWVTYLCPYTYQGKVCTVHVYLLAPRLASRIACQARYKFAPVQSRG